MPLSIDHLRELSLDALVNLLNPDFNIGRTYFKDEDKKYVITHNYNLVHEVNSDENDVDEWETFGYPIELIQQAAIKPVFGSTPKECLLNFFQSHPKLILYDIDNLDKYSYHDFNRNKY